MSARSLNKVMLIGNLTRDPELRYTPQGTPVCTIGVATNRSWVDSNNQHQEETEYHRVVAWSKLAELCHQLLFKGRKVYLEGRLQTRRWTTQSGEERQTSEVVIDEMIVLDNRRRDGSTEGGDFAGGTDDNRGTSLPVHAGSDDPDPADDTTADPVAGADDIEVAEAEVKRPVKKTTATKKVVSEELSADDFQL